MKMISMVSATVSVFSLLFFYYKKKLSYFKNLGIPFVPAWFLFGNMGPVFLKLQSVRSMIDTVYNVNSDALYAGVFDLMRKTILLRDTKLIKSVCVDNFKSFSDHPNFFDASLDPFWSVSVFSLTGEKWREARNVLNSVFTPNNLKNMYEAMTNCSESFVEHLAQRSCEENRMISSKCWFARFSNDNIARCAFSLDIDSFRDADNEFFKVSKETTDLEKLSLKFLLARAAPAVSKFFKIKFIQTEAGDYYKTIVDSIVALKSNEDTKKTDAIQVMLDARNKTGGLMKFDNTEITAQLIVMLLGGVDTTSSQMCVMAHELALNVDVQNKLQEEIDQVAQKTEGRPTVEDISGMAYLDAVFRETVRLHPQPSFFDRVCVREFKLPPALPGLKPYKLKPGDSVWIPVAAINRDSKYYENPEKFDPDRYLFKRVGREVLDLGFGYGPRGCLGKRFATLEIKVLFFHLLRRFDLRPNEKTLNPIRYDARTISVSVEGGFWLSAVPRN